MPPCSKAHKKDVMVIGCGFPDIVRSLFPLEQRGDIQWRGWVDDNPNLAGKVVFDRPVLGGIVEVFQSFPQYEYINTVGLSAKRRHAVHQKLIQLGCRAVKIVHPSVDTKFCEIGDGALISSGVHIEPNTSIGFGTMVLPNTTIGHDCVIGENCFIASGVNIGGNVEIGDFSWIGAATVIHPRSRLGPWSATSQGANVICKSNAVRDTFFESPTKRTGQKSRFSDFN